MRIKTSKYSFKDNGWYRRKWWQFWKKEVKRFLGKPYTIFDYPPKRLYEIYRNPLIVIRTYPSCTAELKKVQYKDNRERLVRILLGEKQKFKKMLAIFKGVRDGLRYKI